MNQKIGIYGGTFDPIHFGHLITTRFVLEQRGLAKIIFVPCNISPLKTGKDSSSAEHRLGMLRIAIEDQPLFDFSDYEIKKNEVSFTYDTLVEMKKHYTEIELIIGYDNLVVFDEWHKPSEIFEIAKVVVMKRFLDKVPVKNHEFYSNAIIVDTPYIEISSTEIRDRVKKKLSIDFLVPSKVKEYILENRLYC